MDNIGDTHSNEMEFDDTDLTSGRSATQVPPVPPLKDVESVKKILQDIMKEDLISKEDLRRAWNKMKSERERLLKQYKKARGQMRYLTSKMMLLERQLNKNSKELEEARGLMLADCMSTD